MAKILKREIQSKVYRVSIGVMIMIVYIMAILTANGCGKCRKATFVLSA